jgi:hypothetical protein
MTAARAASDALTLALINRSAWIAHSLLRPRNLRTLGIRS